MLDKIKQLCESRGITIKELERSLGFSNKALYRWDINSPSIDRVVAVADYFGISVDELIGHKPPETSTTEQNIRTIFALLNQAGQERIEEYANMILNQPQFSKKNSDSPIQEGEAI